MKIVKRLTFRSKVLTVLLLTTMLLSSFSFILIQSIDEINQVSDEIQHQNIPEIIWISHWKEQLTIKEHIVSNYMTNDFCCDLLARYQFYIEQSDKYLEESTTPIPASMQAIKTKIDLLDFMVVNNVRGLLAMGDETAISSYLKGQYLPQLHNIKQEIDGKQDSVLALVNQHSNHFSLIINKSLWLLLVLTSGAIMLAIAAAYRISKNLTKPIEQMVAKVDQIAHGKYGLIIEDMEQVELHKLTSSINKMSIRLQESFYTIVNDKVYREQILNSLPVGIITFDDKLGDISLNYAAKQLLGEKMESLTINSPMEAEENKQFWELFYMKQIIHNVKVPYHLNDDVRSLLISQSELLNQDQEVIGRIFYFIDITETEELEKRMHHSEKLALVGELAAGAAHEIRNPLAVIDGFLSLMSSSLSNVEKEKFHLPLLMMELKRINSIIEEMLLLTKPSAPHFKLCYIEQIINEILPLIRESAGNEQIDFQIQVQHLPLYIDEKQMKQVFHNLIRNSVEAMQGKGKISIYSETKANQYHIYFKDSGPGIPPFMNQSIFDPFLTSKDKGTGLGLTIVQRIIDYHNGEIKLLSSSTEGVIFEITLPLNTPGLK